jgi:hypothetical protein
MTYKRRMNKKRGYKRRNNTLKGGANLSSNLDKLSSVMAQTGQNAFDWSINELAEYTGVDPNKSAEQVLAETASKVENINTVLQSPEGRRLMSELNDLASDVGENVLSPAFEKVAQTAIEKSGDLGKQAVKTGLDVVGMVPGIGEVVEGVRTVSDIVRTGEKVAEASAEFTGIAADATNQLAQKKEEATGLISEFTQLVNNGLEKGLNVAENLNDTISSNLQKKQDNLAKQFDELSTNNIKPISSPINSIKPVNSIENNQLGGTNQDFMNILREAQTGGKLAANRALKSQSGFLKPRFTRKQMTKKFYKSRRR